METHEQIESAAARERLVREAAVVAELDARTLDRVIIGDTESESAHGFEGERSYTGDGVYGRSISSRWRDARDGGWFSYELSLEEGERPQLLRLSFWGREYGERTFDILVNGELIETRSLGDTGKDEFIHLELPLPERIRKGGERVEVKFQAHAGNIAGGVFDVRIVGAQGS